MMLSVGTWSSEEPVEVSTQHHVNDPCVSHHHPLSEATRKPRPLSTSIRWDAGHRTPTSCIPVTPPLYPRTPDTVTPLRTSTRVPRGTRVFHAVRAEVWAHGRGLRDALGQLQLAQPHAGVRVHADSGGSGAGDAERW